MKLCGKANLQVLCPEESYDHPIFSLAPTFSVEKSPGLEKASGFMAMISSQLFPYFLYGPFTSDQTVSPAFTAWYWSCWLLTSTDCMPASASGLVSVACVVSGATTVNASANTTGSIFWDVGTFLSSSGLYCDPRFADVATGDYRLELNRDNIVRWLRDVENITRWQADYSEMARRTAREKDVLCVDLRAAFPREPSELEEYLCEDGIHPNKKGHKLIAEAIENHIHSKNITF